MSTSKTTYSCSKPTCGNHTIGCVNYTPVIVQPYTLTLTIIQQQKPTVNWIATNLLTLEGWAALLTDGCPRQKCTDFVELMILHLKIFKEPCKGGLNSEVLINFPSMVNRNSTSVFTPFSHNACVFLAWRVNHRQRRDRFSLDANSEWVVVLRHFNSYYRVISARMHWINHSV